MSQTPATPNANQWFETELGRYVLAQELSFHDGAVVDVFGYNALQLGHPQADYLRANRIAHKFRVDPGTDPALPAQLRANFDELPIATQSIDLLVMPHVLEFAENPHGILREVDRVMIPEGRIVITGFNPWSLWGMKRWMTNDRGYPWQGNFISLVRLKDWLSLLGFEVSLGRLGCFVPPVSQEKWIQRFRFLEDAGDRWWAIAGGVYMIQAIKRVPGMRIITPAKADWAAQRRLVQAQRAAKLNGGHDEKISHLHLVK